MYLAKTQSQGAFIISSTTDRILLLGLQFRNPFTLLRSLPKESSKAKLIGREEVDNKAGDPDYD